MFSFRHEVSIRRSREEVLALLMRFEDIPKFVPQVVSAEQTSPSVRTRRATTPPAQAAHLASAVVARGRPAMTASATSSPRQPVSSTSFSSRTHERRSRG